MLQKVVSSSVMHRETVSRSCEQSCTEDSSGSDSRTYCCQTDLCNNAVRIQIQMSVALTMALSIVVTARSRCE